MSKKETGAKTSLFLKTISIFTLISFLSTQAVASVPATDSAQDSNTAKDKESSFSIAQTLGSTIVVPHEFGKIEESFQGNTEKTILFIQDAHDSLEAQENIAKLIDQVVKNNGIETVFEEGYEGPVPTDKFFGFIQDPKIKQKVSYFLLDKLRLGGAEYAHINRAQDFDLIGVDSLKLYSENIKAYRDSSENRKETETDLSELFSQISVLANQYFPKELKQWLRSKKRYSKGELPVLGYLKELQALYLKTSSGQAHFLQEYPALSILLAAETTKDEKLIEQLNALDSDVVFEEMGRLEQGLSNTYLQNKRDQRIFDYYQGLSLLKRLNQIQLTQAEYEAVKEILQKLKTRELADFIVSLSGKSLVLSKEWERNISDAVQFYNVARSRDQSINEHLKNFIGSKEEDTAVLVFGGFHATAIKDLLREQGMSYVVISPRITKIEKRHQDYYRQLMSVGHHAFEAPFLAAHANKPPSIFFSAIAADGEAAISSELRTITSFVAAGDSDPQLIERRLVGFLPDQQDSQNGSSKARSEVRNASEQKNRFLKKDINSLSDVPDLKTEHSAKWDSGRLSYIAYSRIETSPSGWIWWVLQIPFLVVTEFFYVCTHEMGHFIAHRLIFSDAKGWIELKGFGGTYHGTMGNIQTEFGKFLFSHHYAGAFSSYSGDIIAILVMGVFSTALSLYYANRNKMSSSKFFELNMAIISLSPALYAISSFLEREGDYWQVYSSISGMDIHPLMVAIPLMGLPFIWKPLNIFIRKIIAKISQRKIRVTNAMTEDPQTRRQEPLKVPGILDALRQTERVFEDELRAGNGRLSNVETIQDLEEVSGIIHDRRVLYVPKEPGELIVIGDLHGDSETLEAILQEADVVNRIKKGKNIKVLFLGDAISSWEKDSLRTALRLFELKQFYPNHFFYIVGNRELDVLQMGIKDGSPRPDKKIKAELKKQNKKGAEFAAELIQNYGINDAVKITKAFARVIQKMPRLALFGNGLVAVHGGPVSLTTLKNHPHPDISQFMSNEKWMDEIVNVYVKENLAQTREDLATLSPEWQPEDGIGGEIIVPKRQSKMVGINRVENMLKTFGGTLLVHGHDHLPRAQQEWVLPGLLTLISATWSETRYARFNLDKNPGKPVEYKSSIPGAKPVYVLDYTKSRAEMRDEVWENDSDPVSALKKLQDHFKQLSEKAKAGKIFTVDVDIRDMDGKIFNKQISLPVGSVRNEKDDLILYLASQISIRGLIAGAQAVSIEVSDPGILKSSEIVRSVQDMLAVRFGRTLKTMGFGEEVLFETGRMKEMLLTKENSEGPSAADFRMNQGESLGFDLGGTNLKIVLLRQGVSLLEESIPIQDIREDVGQFIEKKIKEIGERYGIINLKMPIYVTAPGLVTPDKKIVHITNLEHNKPGTQKSLESLQKRVLTIRFVNDGRAATFYQVIMSGVRNNTIINTLGTGLGLGIVIKGKLFSGPQEPHLKVNFSKDAFLNNGFDMQGDLEAYANAGFLVRRAKEIAHLSGKTLPDNLSPKMIGEWLSLNSNGELYKIARQVFREFGRHLAVLYLQIFRITGISEWNVLLVGGIAKGLSGQMIIEGVQEAIREDGTNLKLTLTLGQEADFSGALGAAYLGLQEQQSFLRSEIRTWSKERPSLIFLDADNFIWRGTLELVMRIYGEIYWRVKNGILPEDPRMPEDKDLQEGIDFVSHGLHRTEGEQLRAILKDALEKGGKSASVEMLSEAFTRFFEKKYKESYRGQITLIPGVEEFFEGIHRKQGEGYPIQLIVLSNAAQSTLELLTESLGIKNEFAQIVGCPWTGSYKKSDKIMEIAGEFPGAFIAMGGDSWTDVEAAKEATRKGTSAVSFAAVTGGTTRERLKEQGADLIVNNLGETAKIFSLFSGSSESHFANVGHLIPDAKPLPKGWDLPELLLNELNGEFIDGLFQRNIHEKRIIDTSDTTEFEVGDHLKVFYVPARKGRNDIIPNLPGCRAVRLSRWEIKPQLAPWMDDHMLLMSLPDKKGNMEGGMATLEDIRDMLNFAERLPGFGIFFNGPGSGASYPQRRHFQMARKVLPIEESAFEAFEEKEGVSVGLLSGYAISGLVFRGEDPKKIIDSLEPYQKFFDEKNIAYNLYIRKVGSIAQIIFVPRKSETSRFMSNLPAFGEIGGALISETEVEAELNKDETRFKDMLRETGFTLAELKTILSLRRFKGLSMEEVFSVLKQASSEEVISLLGYLDARAVRQGLQALTILERFLYVSIFLTADPDLFDRFLAASSYISDAGKKRLIKMQREAPLTFSDIAKVVYYEVVERGDDIQFNQAEFLRDMPKVMLLGPYKAGESKVGQYLAPPLGAYRIASFLKAFGFHVEVYDLDLQGENGYYEHLKKEHYDVIGFSILEPVIKNSARVMHETHEKSPSSLIIAGGQGAAFNPNASFFLENTSAQIVFRGLGEFTMLDALTGFENQKLSPEKIAALRAVYYKTPQNKVREGSLLRAGVSYEDLRLISLLWDPRDTPYLDYWDFIKGFYSPEQQKKMRTDKLSRTVRIYTETHCPMGCKFCTSTHLLGDAVVTGVQPLRLLSAADIFRLIKRVREAHPTVGAIYFNDDNFFLSRSRIKELAELIIKEGLQNEVTFFALSRVDNVDPELLALVKKAGFNMLIYGVENFSEHVLEDMNKRVKSKGGKNQSQMSYDAIVSTLKAGLIARMNLILFFPTVTLDDLKITIDKSTELIQRGAIVDAFEFVEPYGGSEMATELDRYPYRKESFEILTPAGPKTFHWPSQVLPRDPEVRSVALEMIKKKPATIAEFEEKFRKQYGWEEKLPAPVMALIVFYLIYKEAQKFDNSGRFSTSAIEEAMDYLMSNGSPESSNKDSLTKRSEARIGAKTVEPREIYGYLFDPGHKISDRDGVGHQAQAVKKRTSREVWELLKLAKEPLEITAHLRAVDGPGSSLDLPEFQKKLTPQGARFLSDIPATLAVASNFTVKIRFEAAKDPDTIEYVAPQYGITADQPYIVKGKVNLTQEGRAPRGQMDAPAYIFSNIFGISGVRVICEKVSPMAIAGGMESSNAFNGALFAAASMFSGADWSFGDIFEAATAAENDTFGGLTGGQGTLVAFLGGAYHYLWLLGMKGEDGELINRHGAFAIPTLEQNDFTFLEDRMALVQAGKRYENGKSVSGRTAALINYMWTDLLREDKKGFELHGRKPALTEQYINGLKNHDMTAVIDAVDKYVDIRDELCRRWAEAVLNEGKRSWLLKMEARDKAAIAVYGRSQNERETVEIFLKEIVAQQELLGALRKGNLPEIDRLSVESKIKELTGQLDELALKNLEALYRMKTSLYSDSSKELIKAARKQGIAVMPTGAGGPGANLIVIAPQGKQQLEAFLKEQDLPELTDEGVEKIMNGTGVLRGYMPLRVGRTPMKFTGFKEIGITPPTLPVQAVYSEKTARFRTPLEADMINSLVDELVKKGYPEDKSREIISEHIRRLRQREPVDLVHDENNKWRDRLRYAVEWLLDERRNPEYTHMISNIWGEGSQKQVEVDRAADFFASKMKEAAKKNGVRFFIGSGGSGGGKSTIWASLMKRYPHQFRRFLMYTTRDKRLDPDFKDGISERTDGNLYRALSLSLSGKIGDIANVTASSMDPFKKRLFAELGKERINLDDAQRKKLNQILDLSQFGDNGRRYMLDPKRSLNSPLNMEIPLSERIEEKDGTISIYGEFEGVDYYFVDRERLDEISQSEKTFRRVMMGELPQGYSIEDMRKAVEDKEAPLTFFEVMPYVARDLRKEFGNRIVTFFTSPFEEAQETENKIITRSEIRDEDKAVRLIRIFQDEGFLKKDVPDAELAARVIKYLNPDSEDKASEALVRQVTLPDYVSGPYLNSWVRNRPEWEGARNYQIKLFGREMQKAIDKGIFNGDPEQAEKRFIKLWDAFTEFEDSPGHVYYHDLTNIENNRVSARLVRYVLFGDPFYDNEKECQEIADQANEMARVALRDSIFTRTLTLLENASTNEEKARYLRRALLMALHASAPNVWFSGSDEQKDFEGTVQSTRRYLNESLDKSLALDSADEFVREVLTPRSPESPLKAIYFVDDNGDLIYHLYLIQSFLAMNPGLQVSLVAKSERVAIDTKVSDIYHEIKTPEFAGLKRELGKRFRVIEKGPVYGGVKLNNASRELIEALRDSDLVIGLGQMLTENMNGIYKPAYHQANADSKYHQRLTGLPKGSLYFVRVPAGRKYYEHYEDDTRLVTLKDAVDPYRSEVRGDLSHETLDELAGKLERQDEKEINAFVKPILEPFIDPVKGKDAIVLGSGSPRKRKIANLMLAGREVQTASADIDEYLPAGVSHGAAAAVASFQKAVHLLEQGKRGVIITNDTFIFTGEKRLGKVDPATPEEELFNIFKAYSEKMITAFSGLAVIDTRNGAFKLGYGEAGFRLKQPEQVLTNEERDALNDMIRQTPDEYGYLRDLAEQDQVRVEDILKAYIKQEKWKGKAGGFGIQDREFWLCVERVSGNPLSIVGLPSDLLAGFLNDLGVQTTDVTQKIIREDYWPLPVEYQKIYPSKAEGKKLRSEIRHQSVGEQVRGNAVDPRGLQTIAGMDSAAANSELFPYDDGRTLTMEESYEVSEEKALEVVRETRGFIHEPRKQLLFPVIHEALWGPIISEFRFEEPENFRLLDVGVGAGFELETFPAGLRKYLWLMDLGDAILQAANDRYPGSYLLRRDWFDTGLPEGSFDAIAGFDILAQLSVGASDIFYHEMKRILKPNGQMVFLMSHVGPEVKNDERRYDSIDDFLRDHWASARRMGLEMADSFYRDLEPHDANSHAPHLKTAYGFRLLKRPEHSEVSASVKAPMSVKSVTIQHAPATHAVNEVRSELRTSHELISKIKPKKMVSVVRKNTEPATVFVDAEDFENFSEAQKQEYFFVASANKAVRVIVYNERGQVGDKELAAFLELDHVIRTDEDLERTVRRFSNPNVPAIQLSKELLPSAAKVRELRGKVAFFKTTGDKSGTLATALLWAISGGENIRFRGVRQEDGFWTVDETLLDAIQRTYENDFVIAIAA